MFKNRMLTLCGEAELETIRAAVEAEIVTRHRTDRYGWPQPEDALHAILEGDLSQFSWAPANGGDLINFIARYAPSYVFERLTNAMPSEFESMLTAWDVESPLNRVHEDMVAAAKRGAVRAYRALLAAEAQPVDQDGPDPDHGDFGAETRMRDHEPAVAKRRLLTGLRKLSESRSREFVDNSRTLYADCATMSGSRPIGRRFGLDEIADGFWEPLRRAMPGMVRRDDILMGGRSGERDWIAATGYYVGQMVRPLWGLQPIALLRLRFGEFHEIARDRIVATHVVLDMVDALAQAGSNPLNPPHGIEGYCPGPAMHDGLLVHGQPMEESGHSMLQVRGTLEGISRRINNPDGFTSGRLDSFANDYSMFYGPGGVGTRQGRQCWLTEADLPGGIARAGRSPASAATMLADGKYVAVMGWPVSRQMGAAHDGSVTSCDGAPFGTGPMHWWRIDGGAAREGWALADLLDLHLGLGRDVWAEGLSLQKERQRAGMRLPTLG